MPYMQLDIGSRIDCTIRHQLPPHTDLGDMPMLLSGAAHKIHAIELIVGRATAFAVQEHFPWLVKLARFIAGY